MTRVEERPEQQPLVGRAVLGALHLEAVGDDAEVDRPGAGCRVAHGEQPSGPDHDVDLTALEVVAAQLAVVDGDVEALAVPQELRALVRVGEGFDHAVGQAQLGVQRRLLVVGHALGVDPHDGVVAVDGVADVRRVDVGALVDAGCVPPGSDHADERTYGGGRGRGRR